MKHLKKILQLFQIWHISPTLLPFVIKHSWRLEGMHKSRGGVPGHSATEPSGDGVSLVRDLNHIVLLLGALPDPPDPVVGADRHDDLLFWSTVCQVYGVVLKKEISGQHSGLRYFLFLKTTKSRDFRWILRRLFSVLPLQNYKIQKNKFEVHECNFFFRRQLHFSNHP